jgi:hypothetical protein
MRFPGKLFVSIYFRQRDAALPAAEFDVAATQDDQPGFLLLGSVVKNMARRFPVQDRVIERLSP